MGRGQAMTRVAPRAAESGWQLGRVRKEEDEAPVPVELPKLEGIPALVAVAGARAEIVGMGASSRDVSRRCVAAKGAGVGSSKTDVGICLGGVNRRATRLVAARPERRDE